VLNDPALPEVVSNNSSRNTFRIAQHSLLNDPDYREKINPEIDIGSCTLGRGVSSKPRQLPCGRGSQSSSAINTLTSIDTTLPGLKAEDSRNRLGPSFEPPVFKSEVNHNRRTSSKSNPVGSSGQAWISNLFLLAKKGNLIELVRNLPCQFFILPMPKTQV